MEIFFKSEDEVKAFSGKRKLQDFVVSRPALGKNASVLSLRGRNPGGWAELENGSWEMVHL